MLLSSVNMAIWNQSILLSWRADVTIKMNAFFLFQGIRFALQLNCVLFLKSKDWLEVMAKSVFMYLCVFFSILDNRKYGLFLEMKPDGSVRGSSVEKLNCKQLLHT